MAAGRSDDGLAVGYDGVAELREDERPVGRVTAALGGVILVVQADAHDLARLRNGRCRGQLSDSHLPVAEPDNSVRAEAAEGHPFDRPADAAQLARGHVREQALGGPVVDELRLRRHGDQLGLAVGASDGWAVGAAVGAAVELLGTALGPALGAALGDGRAHCASGFVVSPSVA